MLFKVYSILLYVFAIFFFPFMAIKLAMKGKERAGLSQRFGKFERGFFERERGAKVVWVHAVSVGETLAAVPLVKALKEKRPDISFYFTTVTETGQKVALESLGDIATVFYFPFDFARVVSSVVAMMKPDLFVVVETEIWPNLLKTLHDRGIPSVMVNGRISPRSFKGYKRAGRLMGRVLELFSAFNMQTAQDAERIKALGAPASRVSVVGNVKFDQAAKSLGQAGRDVFTKSKLGIPESALVFMAGSTHDPEEREVLNAYRELLKEFPGAFLILVPRHPERLQAVEDLASGEGFRVIRKTRLDGSPISGPSVILVDTMGELAALYRAGDICFVGGSFVPVGGHNVLEPAAFGKPVFFGPFMHNFREIAAILKDTGVGIEVGGGAELAREAIRLMNERERYDRIGKIAREMLLKYRGALDRNIGTIESLLNR
jgi:3-deoxy-D-manno-octulosonic-acid transferase